MVPFALVSILAVLIVVGIFTARAYDRFLSERAELALFRNGRSIVWSEAIDRVQRGDGYLIENRSELPGRLLWVPYDADRDVGTYEMVRDESLIVTRVSVEHAEEETRAMKLSDRYLVIAGWLDRS